MSNQNSNPAKPKTSHQMARYLAGSGSTLVLKIILNELFIWLGLVAWFAYFITHIVIVVYAYFVHSLFTFDSKLSFRRFGKFVMSILTVKIADYVLFNIIFYGATEKSWLSIVIATGLLWFFRFFAIRKSLEMSAGELETMAAKKFKRVAIIGGTISGNRGAEAMLCTAIGQVRAQDPNVVVELFSYYPNEDRQLVRDPRIRVHSCTPAHLVGVILPFAILAFLMSRVGLRRAVKNLPADVYALFDADILLDIAGVSFIDGREKFLPFNIATILPALMFGVPVVKLAQAMGPFEHHINRICARLFLTKCRTVFARGEKTYNHLQELDRYGKWIARADDVAFCYEDEYSLSQENEGYVRDKLTAALARLKQTGPVIGICPSSLVASKGFEEGTSPYIDQVELTVRRLLKANKSILLFPNATRAGSERFRNNDIKIIDILENRLNAAPEEKGAVEFINQDVNTKSIRALIRECDMVIVSRFHAMIAALAQGVPCVVLGWSHKYLEVMKSFGMQDYVFPYTEFEPEKVARLVDDILSRREAVSAAILTAAEEAKRNSRHQFEVVNKYLA